MARGGKRPGAGRKVGSLTKRTRDIAEKATAAGESPLEHLLRIMRDPTVDPDIRRASAVAAAPYCHSRLNATTLKGPDEGPLTVEIRRFTYAADDAANSGPRPVVNLGGYSAEQLARDELDAAKAKLLEMTAALPLLPPPDLD